MADELPALSTPPPRPPAAPPFSDCTPIASLTGMRVHIWSLALSAGGARSYAALHGEQTQQILRAIEFGAPVDFEGDRSIRRQQPNHPIDEAHLQKVRDVIAADVKDNKKAGPLPREPWPYVNGYPLCASPIGAVPKKNSVKVRVIHDLSAPKGGDSINGGIEDGSLEISSFGHAAQAVRRAGRGAWLIKLDVEAAYKQMPVRPEDWHLLGFEFEGKLYYERVLPFGLRSSCRLWELIAAALHFMCEKLDCGAPHEVIHYVDDFLFVVSPIGGEPAAQRLLALALALCQHLGVPMATGPGKVEGPAQCLTFLGIELDALKLEARLPQQRLDELHALMVEWQSYTRASVKQLQSLTGLLNFACTCVAPGRVYLSRLIKHTAHIIAQNIGRSHHTQVKLTPAALADVQWWVEMLREWNGVSLLYEDDWTSAPRIQLYTDACNTGYGAYYAGRWLAGQWSNAELQSATRKERISMPFLEMRALVMAAATWGHLWRGKKITFHCDCQPVVQAFKDMRSRTVTQMHQIRSMHLLAAQHNFDFRVWHIVGETNVVADELSRAGASQAFRDMCPSAKAQPDCPQAPPLPTTDDI